MSSHVTSLSLAHYVIRKRALDSSHVRGSAESGVIRPELLRRNPAILSCVRQRIEGLESVALGEICASHRERHPNGPRDTMDKRKTSIWDVCHGEREDFYENGFERLA